MELKYVVMTIIKILISVPTVLLTHSLGVNGAALMGGHFDNKNNSTNLTEITDSYFADYDIYDSQELSTSSSEISEVTETKSKTINQDNDDSEEIPNPSPLVLPGYNLPENIFNKGKPFYLEKDPLTGKIDFNNQSPSKSDDEMYDYVNDEPSDNIYDKANINRKDGSLNSHRPSDVNQLTPNFHDFLNLPVKYNPNKYVYPLISSSYANTKIQGNVNKYYNHKDYNVKTSTYKSTSSPTYYSSTKKQYFNPDLKTTKKPDVTTTTTTTTTTARTTTKKSINDIYLTTKSTQLLSGAMGHPSLNEDFETDYDESSPQKSKPSEIYLTTENINNIYLTTKSPMTTTRRTLSLLEHLFGDYDETVTTTDRTKSPPLFLNLPTNKNTKTKYEGEIKTEKPSYTTPYYPNSHAGPNVLSGSNMGIDTSYQYEEEYSGEMHHEDSVAVESKPAVVIQNVTYKIDEYVTPKYENLEPSKNPADYSDVDLQNNTDYSEYEYQEKEMEAKTTTPRPTTTTTTITTTIKVTSLPLGENHVSSLNNRQPIIVATQNLKEKLNSERVQPKPFDFDKPVIQHAPSTSNIHIAPDQDTVSFVVGNHQNVDGGQYVGSSLKGSPYDSNPFRPLFGQQATYSNKDTVSYTIQASPDHFNPPPPPPLPPPISQNFSEVSGSAVTIQPLKNSEASLTIGVPVNSIKQIPGQVVDDKLEVDEDEVKYPGTKIVFPDEKDSGVAGLFPPPQQPLSPQPPTPLSLPQSNREVLQLSSKPMYHQLPSDLTPPKEKEVVPPPRMDRPRPPWDPRPGHFYSGKPEYVRPPRPPPEIAFKRIDNLPNILPQFRPNMNVNSPPPHYFDNRLLRQPLLERPSNRPIGFFEKLQPPPPPPPHSFQNLRKLPPPPPQSLDEAQHAPIAEDRIINEGPKKPAQDHFGFYHTPPKIMIANRRNGEDDADVETLQMLQAKHSEKKEPYAPTTTSENAPEKPKGGDKTEKPLYVVYPVNTPPIKLDVIETNKKESVVIGTRAELPLPPSKINKDFIYEQNPILSPKDRNDAPILKPHPRPPTFPVKSDFPYPLERPDPSVIHPAVPETPSNNGNNLDEPTNVKYGEDPSFNSGSQWNTVSDNIESRIVTGTKINTHNSNQISVTLKTYTEKPIAVAYTPTEPHLSHEYDDKFSMPNYGSPVIPEIRPGTVDNAEVGHQSSNNEFTVSAVMHTHPQSVLGVQNKDSAISKRPVEDAVASQNHRIDTDMASIPTQLDFQAPFQASVNIDSTNQGWSVVRDKNKTTTEVAEVTTIPIATTSEFDIENFKPQLIGGFKPIYSYPEDEGKPQETEVNEREEK